MTGSERHPATQTTWLNRIGQVLLLATLLCSGRGYADDALAGDSPADPGPHAALSGAMRPADIRRAARKVADWQLARVQRHTSTDWTFAPLYLGLLRTSALLHDPRYADHVRRVAAQLHDALGPREHHADDQAIAQVYLALYRQHRDPALLAAMMRRYRAQMQVPDDPAHPLWWWCDALFMAPPSWAGLSEVTGQSAYLDYMNRQWWITSQRLYDTRDHLFSRDASYLDQHEKNGRKLYWSRGNGWVMAGLARVLERMPKDYPARGRYLAQFRAMATALAAAQGRDGLWRAGLLDAASYPRPETSGSAFIAYALAWGIRHRLLDAATYRPVVQRAWRGLVAQIYADGRLGNIQPIGAAPGVYVPGSSYVYGVGAFLLAASEIVGLSERGTP